MEWRGMERAVRLILLMSALDSHPWTARDLAACFGVSKRTILRDLCTIGGAELGYPLVFVDGLYQKWNGKEA